MAPPRRHATPAEQMVALARDARRAGLTFEQFWRRALEQPSGDLRADHEVAPGAVRWPTDRVARQTDRAALEETREGWRLAYEGMPAPSKHAAVAVLYAALIEHDGTGPLVAA